MKKIQLLEEYTGSDIINKCLSLCDKIYGYTNNYEYTNI